MASSVDERKTRHFFDRICCINLRRRHDRWISMLERTQQVLGSSGRFIWEKMERSEAVDGSALDTEEDLSPYCCLEWDATNNARWDRNIPPPFTKKMTRGEIGCVLSHISLWKELSLAPKGDATMLILEDDVVFYPGKPRNPGFVEALSSLIDMLPPDWEMVYLGFCNFGPRNDVVESSRIRNDADSTTAALRVQIFRPTYGFYTHAYALKQSGASRLMEKLPVAAPLDVWLADNNWFGLKVYVSVVPSKEGLKGNGVSLIAQRRVDSDIVHSAHHSS